MPRNIRDVREENNPKKKNIKEYAKNFYQHKSWRQFREEMRKIKRAEHEAIVMDVYENNPENKPSDLMQFLEDEKQYPLSEMSLKKGLIKRASVLDHIIPIKAGGAEYDPNNVQWLTKIEHRIKTQAEQRAEYKHEHGDTR